MNSTPTPSPSPTPTPSPSPTPTAINFDTAEYRRSNGAVFHEAITAWQEGASGEGVTVGVIDTGIDIPNPEFSGRISSASRAFGGNSSYQDEDGHGTAVTGVLAAARDGREIMGIAFESTIMALRADSAGTCGTEDDCSFFDSDIAAALDHARLNGVRVVNISLGGDGASSRLLTAVDQATKGFDGMIIVVSAGNERNDPDADYDTNSPSPFAQALLGAGNGKVIIATSVNQNGTISDFSSLAGTAQESVLSALGEGVRSFEMEGAFLYSGTSFSAPQVSGAAVLLAQAFPNLTSAQIVELLLSTATDAGATGTDSVYGQGILNIAAAFAPQGTTSLAGSTTPVSLRDNGTLSAPMGDAASTARARAVILDSYGRAYEADLGRSLRMDMPSLSLAPLLRTGEQRLAAAGGGTRMAVTIAETPHGGASVTPLMLSSAESGRARAQAGYIAARLGTRIDLALGFSQEAGSLAAMVRGKTEPAFLLATSPARSTGFGHDAESSFALRWQLQGFALTVAGESGDALVRREWNDPLRADYRRLPYAAISIGVDGEAGPAAFAFFASHVQEDNTVLGARFDPLLGGGSARTLFIDADLRLTPGSGWGMGAAWRQGWTSVAAGGVLKDGALLKSNSFALDLWKEHVLDTSDRFALRLSQPLRISSGGLNLTLPVSFDYATEQAGYGIQRFNLAPRGRQIDLEAAYSRALGWGDITANLYYRKDSGNIAWYPDDVGMAVRFSTGF